MSNSQQLRLAGQLVTLHDNGVVSISKTAKATLVKAAHDSAYGAIAVLHGDETLHFPVEALMQLSFDPEVKRDMPHVVKVGAIENRSRKAVKGKHICTGHVVRYPSVTAAGLDFTPNGVSACCHGRRNHHYGYAFEFDND